MTSQLARSRAAPDLERLAGQVRGRTLPPVLRLEGAREAVRAADAATGRRVVVLDDDPTGSQLVHDVPLLLRWADDDLAWALERPGPVFVLTNTRSLDAPAADRVVREVAGAVGRVAAARAVEPVLVSRGDSTLRGHFAPETGALADVARAEGAPYDAVLLVPAFPEAGRVTLDGVHLVLADDRLVPAGTTSYAQDASFGYRSSFLPDWIEEQLGHAPPVGTRVVDLDLIRTGGPDAVGRVLLEATGGAYVVVDALTPQDLDVVALAVVQAQAQGWRPLCRTGPGFAAARAGVATRGALEDAELRAEYGDAAGHGGGLVVVGSHVPLSTRQLRQALELPGTVPLELDVAALEDDAAAETARVATAARSVPPDRVVMLSSSRTEVRPSAGTTPLDLARRVSEALVALTRLLVAERDPAWVVGKGGITSHDVARHGLGLDRAVVTGQLLDGAVSLFRPAGDGVPHPTYAVFPGNVGDDHALADVVRRLQDATSSQPVRPPDEGEAP